jgi:hypothetical protein
MAKSKVMEIGKIEFAKQTSQSKFNTLNFYNPNHRDALSDGDEHGKGPFKGSVGSKTDIMTRGNNIMMNPYNPNNHYRVDD